MPRRRRTRRRASRGQTLPYDFFGFTSAGSKSITKSDLGIESGRQFRVVRVHVEAAVSDKTDYFLPQFPTLYCAVNHGSASDVCTTSRPVTLSVATRSVNIRVPRIIDYSAAPSNYTVVQLYFVGMVTNLTVSFSGTVWIQFAGHKFSSKVALLDRIQRMTIKDDSESNDGEEGKGVIDSDREPSTSSSSFAAI